MKQDQSHITDLISKIPLEIWQGCIFEYWLGPIYEINNQSTIEEIMKFKNSNYLKIIAGLDLENVRSIHKFCWLISKKFREMFVVEMDEFWLKVSNVLEMAIYWRRYETSKDGSLAKGDMTTNESIPFVKMQKLIEATEMNLNREYTDIIDPSLCCHWNEDPTDDWKSTKNDIDTDLMHQDFIKRVEKLLISKEKYEKIRQITQLNACDLFLHKSLVLSLDMIAYYDSERSCRGYDGFDSEEECRLFNKGLFNKQPSSNSLGLIISESTDNNMDSIDSKFIAISISSSEWGEKKHSNIPKNTQFLCFTFNHESLTGYKGLIDKPLFDEEDPEFPNVREIIVKIEFPEDELYYLHNLLIEKNIMSGITRSRFPKLIRISIRGFGSMESLLESEILSQLLYVEIILSDYGINWDDIIPHWSERHVHEFVKRKFLQNDSLIHHLILHARIKRQDKDADHDSIKEYYDLCSPKFVASISHSSFNEYYDGCYE